jgi:hypothetical protein
MFRVFPLFLVTAATLLTSGSISCGGAELVEPREFNEEDFRTGRISEWGEMEREFREIAEDKAKVLQPEYDSLLGSLSPDARAAINDQIAKFNDKEAFIDGERNPFLPLQRNLLLEKTIDLLKDNYARRTRQMITDDLLTRAIDATPDQTFSSGNDLIAGIEKNIQAPSSAKPEFEIASGELKFPYERDIGGMKIKIGTVRVYEILKRILVIAGGGAIVSCVASDQN